MPYLELIKVFGPFLLIAGFAGGFFIILRGFFKKEKVEQENKYLGRVLSEQKQSIEKLAEVTREGEEELAKIDRIPIFGRDRLNKLLNQYSDDEK